VKGNSGNCPDSFMDVFVQLHTTLREQLANKEVRWFEQKLPHGSSVNELLETLKLNAPGESLIIVINGKVVSLDDALADGDKIDIIPAISGG
jgi:sulfur carrier protein ThiS